MRTTTLQNFFISITATLIVELTPVEFGLGWLGGSRRPIRVRDGQRFNNEEIIK